MDFFGRNDELHYFQDHLDNNSDLDGRIIAIFGPGDIGKSRFCERLITLFLNHGVIVFHVNFKSVNSAFDILQSFVSSSGIDFPNFTRQLSKFSALQSKIAGDHSASQSALKKFLAGGVGAAVGSVIGGAVAGPPGASLGTILGASLGEIGKSMTEEAIHRTVTLSKELNIDEHDLKFYNDPTTYLLDAFIQDIALAAVRNRYVFIFDEYEWNVHFDHWIRDEFMVISEQVLNDCPLIIAGRDALSYKWNKLNRAIIPMELQPLEPPDAVKIALSYGLEQQSAEAIAKASNGIPGLIVTNAQFSAANESFPILNYSRSANGIELQHIDRVFDHLSSEQRELAELAAMPQEFDKASLAFLWSKELKNDLFDSLIRLSFVGFNDTTQKWFIKTYIRSLVLGHLKKRDQEAFKAHSEQLTAYFMKRFEESTADIAVSYGLLLEVLYHAFEVDHDFGLNILINSFNNVLAKALYWLCDVFVNETVSLVQQQKIEPYWEFFVKGRYQYIRNDWDQAISHFLQLRDILENQQIYPLALTDLQLGRIYFHRGRLQDAFNLYTEANTIFTELRDEENILNSFNQLGRISRRKSDNSELSATYHRRVINYPGEEKFYIQRIEAFRCLSRLARDKGYWAQALDYCNKSIALAVAHGKPYDENLAILRKAEILYYQHCYDEALADIESTMAVLNKFGNWLTLSYAYQLRVKILGAQLKHSDIFDAYANALLYAHLIDASTAIQCVKIDLCRYLIFSGQLNSAGHLLRSLESGILIGSDQSLLVDLLQVKVYYDLLRGSQTELRTSLDKLDGLINDQSAYNYMTLVFQGVLMEFVLHKHTLSTDKIAQLKSDSVHSGNSDIAFACDVILPLLPQPKETGNQTAIAIRKLERLSPMKASYLGLLLGQSEYLLIYQQRKRTINWTIAGIPQVLRTKADGTVNIQSLQPLLKLREGTQLIFVHHNITDHRLQDIVQGRDDTLLAGIAGPRIRAMTDHLIGKLSERNLSSSRFRLIAAPSLRCIDTAVNLVADQFATDHQLIKITTENRLLNMSMGGWEGMRKPDLYENRTWNLMKTGTNLTVKADGTGMDGGAAESVLDVLNRTYPFFKELAENQKPTIVVGHKMSAIIPAIFFFFPHLLADGNGDFNWRQVPFTNGGFLIIDDKEIFIGE